ncbi:hypothetical protein BH11MYX2_BH11MYX2_22440 [soil metagenome]
MTRPWNIGHILRSGAPLLDREFDDVFRNRPVDLASPL